MQPDVLCINLIGFLSIFGLEGSLLLYLLYYLVTAILICASISLAAYGCVLLYGWYFHQPSKIKRGKFGE